MLELLDDLRPEAILQDRIRLLWSLEFRRAVQKAGLSLADVAKLSDVHPVTVRRWHNGTVTPAARQARAVLRMLLERDARFPKGPGVG